MKPSTPRKPRRRNQPPGGAGLANTIPVSDYEADALGPPPAAAFASASAAASAAATPVDTNVQAVPNLEISSAIRAMNLRVVQRYHPTIQSCEPGPPTSVYAYDRQTDSWGASVGLGGLFVCDRYPDHDASTDQPIPRPCIFILNRKDPDNFFIDLSKCAHLVQADHPTDHGMKLMVQVLLEDSDNPDDPRLWGLVGDVEPMKATFAKIQEKLDAVKAARSSGP